MEELSIGKVEDETILSFENAAPEPTVVRNDGTYRLHGICMHDGVTPNDGRYYTINNLNDKWYSFMSQSAEEMREKRVFDKWKSLGKECVYYVIYKKN